MQNLVDLVQFQLQELKAQDIQIIELRGKTDLADYMVLASGTSDRHLHALADRVVQGVKAAGHDILGVEGEDSRDWVLVDLGDVIVHIMRPEARELYALEKLWSMAKRAD